MATAEQLTAELQVKNQQLQQVTAAFNQLQLKEASSEQKERICREVRFMSTFTGTGDITINAFISSVEYYLSTTSNEELKKCITRTIFYEKIQGEAKNTVINIPNPDNWAAIKLILKTRYRPDTEPSEIYKRINNLRVNSVSELAIEIQSIKYKCNELIIYYTSDSVVDLSNVDSLLVYTIKEMTQGVLLEKIYEEKDLGKIVEIMRSRRFEDSCVREEYKRFRHIQSKNQSNPRIQKSQFQDDNRNVNSNKNMQDRYYANRFQSRQHDSGNNGRDFNNYNYNNSANNFKPQFQDSGHNRRNFNNNGLGNFRAQYQESGNNRRPFNNNSGNFRRQYHESGNPRENSGQYRQQQNYFRQRPVEPMEVDNIQRRNKEIEETNNVAFFMN